VARPWLKVEPALVKHRKTRKLAKLWHCHPYQVVGFLVSLWGYCLEFQEDGDVTAMLDVELEELAAPCVAQAIGTLPTVREALREAGFLDANGRLHDWTDYTGGLSVERRKARKRQQLHRERQGVTSRDARDVSHNEGRDVTPQSRVEQSRVEESREETKSSAAAAEVVAELRASLPEPYRDTLDGLLRSAQRPTAAAYSIRALGPGGIHEKYPWDVIGRALFELAAAGARFSPAVLGAFCRRIVEAPPASPGGVMLTDAERMRQLAEQEAGR